MKNLIKLSIVLVAASTLATSCNCFKEMAKDADSREITCTPKVLELNNGKVVANISVTFDEMYFNRKASLRITPAMVYATGVTKGETFILQGEKVVDNGIVVKKEDKFQLQRTVEFAYIPEMAKSKLVLLVEVKCKKGKCKEFTYINANNGELLTEAQQAVIGGNDKVALDLINECGYVLATGVNTLQKDIDYSVAMDAAANNYKNVTTEITKADIVYKINCAKVGKNALKNEQFDNLKSTVEKNNANAKATQSLYVNGYASPDGPEKFNDKLSAKRSETGTSAIQKFLGEAGLKIDAASYGEDWEGFQEAVAASSIEDKDLILQVLKMYSSSADRENEIKNMAAVFKKLKTEVLPQLRRAQVVNSADIQGKTDQEMLDLINAGKASELTAEELLHIAEVKPEVAVVALTTAAEKYNDARAWNNLAVEQAKAGNYAEAQKSLDKAAAAGCPKDVLNNNLALVALGNGDVAKAESYAVAGDKEAQALVAASKGQYATAENGLTGYNAAIAQTQQGKYAEAKKSLEGDASAKAEYLRAVIANKEGNITAAREYLKSAVAKDPSLEEKAKNDINLAGAAF